MQDSRSPASRVLIANAYPLLREAVGRLIESAGGLDVCGLCGELTELPEQVEQTRPDLILLEISADGCSSLEVIAEVHRRWPTVKLLLTSLRDQVALIARGMQHGARGHASWREEPDELVAAVRQVLRGEDRLTATVARHLVRHTVGGDSSDGHWVGSLSDRELAVFEAIGQGLTCKQIARLLDVSTRTVESHRKTIRVKLKLSNSTRLMQMAVQWACSKDSCPDIDLASKD